MEYRWYGETGIKLSELGCGGMRFQHPEKIESSAEIVLRAFKRGINYFDTAPGYCQDMSEKIMGLAFKEMKKSTTPFYVSTKSNMSNGKKLRNQLDYSLKTLGVGRVDFFHCWCLMDMRSWKERKAGGAVDELLKAKEEGLIRHIAFSTHMPGHEIRQVIEEGIFEGVTLGYSAANFPFREEGIEAARENNLGVIVMNPLGGGSIVKNKETFEFLKIHPKQTLLEAALQFLRLNTAITSSIVGFRTVEDVDSAVEAMNGAPFTETHLNRVKNAISDELNQLCTGCAYCRNCPEGIEVWKFVETTNHLFLKTEIDVSHRLKYDWGTTIEELDRCTECLTCVESCTQHLPILQRFELLKRKIDEQRNKRK